MPAWRKMRDPEKVRKWVDRIGPLVSVAAVIVLIVGCVVGLKKAEISMAAGPLFLSVLALACGGALDSVIW